MHKSSQSSILNHEATLNNFKCEYLTQYKHDEVSQKRWSKQMQNVRDVVARQKTYTKNI